MDAPDVIVDLRDVGKVHGSGRTEVRALERVSLHVTRGELLLVMGPSGSGKTTLLQIIGALLRPSRGRVFLNGVDLAAQPSRRLARIRLTTIGFVFQTGNLLSALTAAENVELVLALAGIRGRTTRDRVAKLLSLLQLSGRAHRRPDSLSVGEQQRVAIARALANDPPLILADEPTASLDSKTGYLVVEILRDIAKREGKTVVVVTHDQRLKGLADRIVWLEDGRLTLQEPAGSFVVDPVCLMLVDPAATTHRARLDGRDYWFCSPRCGEEFLADPSRYEVGRRGRS